MSLFNTDFNQPIKHNDSIIFLPNLIVNKDKSGYTYSSLYKVEYVYFNKEYIFDSLYNPFFFKLNFKKKSAYFSYVLINGNYKFSFFTDQIYKIAIDNNLFDFQDFYTSEKKILNIRSEQTGYTNYKKSFITTENIDITEELLKNKEFKIENYIERNSIAVKNNAEIMKDYINTKKYDDRFKNMMFKFIDEYTMKLRENKFKSLL